MKKSTPSGSTATSISTKAIEHIVERLKSQNNRTSTKKTYYNVWKKFNQFYIRLDRKPKTWEDRLILFVGYLINDKKQSSTIKSYISAIRSVLSEDGVTLNENKFLLTSLTKACRLKNDRVKTRFPIQKGVLKILLKTTNNYYRGKGQSYLAKLYRALFVSAYFGLLRVGELTAGPHAIMVKNVHIGENKNKVLFILESSKTHGRNRRPQMVKMSSKKIPSYTGSYYKSPGFSKEEPICAYTMIREYLRVRITAVDKREQFFVFADGSPVHPN